jgi:RNA polymerase primary sigma factor
MRYKEITQLKEPTSEANYFKADTTFRQKRLPTLEPDPVDNADEFDISKHDQSTDDGPDIDITNAQVRAQVTQMLLKLPPRMERMLRERFFQGLTLDQIGEKYGISRERVRQIEAKALRMLKHPSRTKILRPLLNNELGTN